MRNEAGAVENFIAMLTDITARVETENYLRRAKEEADAASRAKSEFLASMSHEIRTPMNGVIGMTSLLLETPLTAEQRDCVNTIRSSGDALLAIINDILDFSKIESGKMELEQQPFELAACMEEALDLFAVQAAAKHIDLAYFIDPGVPAWIVGDVTRLRQVMVNLAQQRRQIHPPRLCFHRGAAWRRPNRGAPVPPSRPTNLPHRDRRARHRHRHSAGKTETAVQAILTGRLLHHAQIWRHRSRPRHLPAALRVSWAARFGSKASRATAPCLPSPSPYSPWPRPTRPRPARFPPRCKAAPCWWWTATPRAAVFSRIP